MARAPSEKASLSVALALAACTVALGALFASPLPSLLGLRGWSWRFLAFWFELGGVLLLIALLFRLPWLAWLSATLVAIPALGFASVVWPANLVGLALLGAVGLWHQSVRGAAMRASRTQAQGVG